MQALELVLGTLINPGDTVLTEEYTYSGTLGIMRHFKANIEGVSMDYIDGMDMDDLSVEIEGTQAKKYPSVAHLYDLKPSESKQVRSSRLNVGNGCWNVG